MDEKDKMRARRDDQDAPNKEFVRAENEDDDGYDPYSDRRPDPEPLFERDPWAQPGCSSRWSPSWPACTPRGSRLRRREAPGRPRGL